MLMNLCFTGIPYVWNPALQFACALGCKMFGGVAVESIMETDWWILGICEDLQLEK
jgi:hypothetical protein